MSHNKTIFRFRSLVSASSGNLQTSIRHILIQSAIETYFVHAWSHSAAKCVSQISASGQFSGLVTADYWVGIWKSELYGLYWTKLPKSTNCLPSCCLWYGTQQNPSIFVLELCSNFAIFQLILIIDIKIVLSTHAFDIFTFMIWFWVISILMSHNEWLIRY